MVIRSSINKWNSDKFKWNFLLCNKYGIPSCSSSFHPQLASCTCRLRVSLHRKDFFPRSVVFSLSFISRSEIFPLSWKVQWKRTNEANFASSKRACTTTRKLFGTKCKQLNAHNVHWCVLYVVWTWALRRAHRTAKKELNLILMIIGMHFSPLSLFFSVVAVVHNWNNRRNKKEHKRIFNGKRTKKSERALRERRKLLEFSSIFNVMRN